MRILHRLHRGEPAFSFEFFPPKTPAGDQKLWEALAELRSLEPAFVSVTYGAGGSTRQKTVELTGRIRRELGLEAMAHLTCVGASRSELVSVLAELRDAGVENVLALRGDPPKGQSHFVAAEGGFQYASELVRFIKDEGFDVCVGGACYPEGHIEAVSLEADLAALKRKVDAGVEFLITQLFFDNKKYFSFVDRARAAGIEVPILPGIMPITNVEQIQRFTQLCGATLPPLLATEMERQRNDPMRVLELGISHAAIQCLGLLQGGAPGIHFYTLNQSPATREILTAIRTNARL